MRNILYKSINYFILALGLSFSIYIYIFYFQKDEMTEECTKFTNNYLQERPSHTIITTNAEFEIFYSHSLGTCILAVKDKILINYHIWDVNRNFLKRRPLESGQPMAPLFTCYHDGIDNVVLSKVKKFKGKLDQVKYDEYMDNGEGGLPRAVKSPNEDYTYQKCEIFYTNKLKEIRQ